MIRVRIKQGEGESRAYLVEGRRGSKYVARSGSAGTKDDRKAKVQQLINEVVAELTPPQPA